MDIIFDIDGTLADATHRLHFIKDLNYWITPRGNSLAPRKPDWDSFLSDEQVSKDSPIPQTWTLLNSFWGGRNNILFATSRNEKTRDMTVQWLLRHITWQHATYVSISGYLYMRSENDHRPSDQVKRDLLQRIRSLGYDPTLVFEDRKEDTAMWRSEGLLCCQVAEGNY